MKGGKTIESGKDSLFNKWCQENQIFTCERVQLEPNLTPYTEINTKLINDFNVRCTTIKLLEENMGENLHDIELGNGFLNLTLGKAQATNEKIDKWDCIKQRLLCTKEHRVKRGKMFVSHISDKELISKICKALL